MLFLEVEMLIVESILYELSTDVDILRDSQSQSYVGTEPSEEVDQLLIPQVVSGNCNPDWRPVSPCSTLSSE